MKDSILDQLEILSVTISGQNIQNLYGNGTIGRWKNLNRLWMQSPFPKNLLSLAIAYTLWGSNIAKDYSEKESQLISLLSKALLDDPALPKVLKINTNTVELALRIGSSYFEPRSFTFKLFFDAWCKLLKTNWTPNLIKTFTMTQGCAHFSYSDNDIKTIEQYQHIIVRLIPSATTWTMNKWLDFNVFLSAAQKAFGYDYSSNIHEVAKLLGIVNRIENNQKTIIDVVHFPLSLATVLWPNNTTKMISDAFQFSCNTIAGYINNNIYHPLTFEDTGIYKLVCAMSMDKDCDRDIRSAWFTYVMTQ